MMELIYKRIALETAEKKPNGITWYNLEVAFSRRGYGGEVNALGLAEELVAEGLLIVAPDKTSTLLLYQLTDAGKDYLKQQCGRVIEGNGLL
ncbi:hypothetical protein HNQ59_003964 [Chitinivorax tropicus]|uniref:MarR family transcriptional regulator n=1 Tax=Chitinivorax tropicus TaxID=714531 RepID=A0A840MU82_9PROT|nr:hypothetical protein [Chitinivorax tropicus]MBB5020639.1 hypothetical protein [Chitinivorax tropicus]